VSEAGERRRGPANSIIEGELSELIDEFSEGKVQFAFVKVRDSNSGLAKFVLIGWVRRLMHHLCSMLIFLRSVEKGFLSESRVISRGIWLPSQKCCM